MSIYGPYNCDKSQDRGTGDLSENTKKTYVNQWIEQSRQKPIVTVWAEEKGTFERDAFEWSFVKGSNGRQHSLFGYTMMAPGRILRTGLASDLRDKLLRVNITVNGRTFNGLCIEKPTGRYSAVSEFGEELRTREESQGYRINYKTT